MTIAIEDRLQRFLQPDFHLRKGAGQGVNSHVDVCAMQAVAWLAGENISVLPPCACSTICRYVIRLNDSSLFSDHRDELKPFLPRIIGTESSTHVKIRRGFIAADYAVRVFTPIRLRALYRKELAQELESLAPIDSMTSAKTARDAAKKIRADVAADAAAYAYAASAYVAVAADAAAYATSAAYVAACAAAYATSAALRSKALECLDRMISVQ